MIEIGNQLMHTEFLQREYAVKHAPYEKEMAFYNSIAAGDIDKVRSLMTPLASSGYGVISEDGLRNIRYHHIISIAFITRFCIENGMEPEEAYSLSDILIRKADVCQGCENIRALHEEMICEFTARMKQIAKGDIYSKAVLKCFDYVYDNLHHKILVRDIAENVSLSVPYLSKLFHSETGITLTGYITKKRVEAAQNMLKFSDISAVDISNFLAFSSHSHFIHVFKKHTGVTPNEYRFSHFRVNLKRQPD